MDPHHHLASDHNTLRGLASTLQTVIQNEPTKIQTTLLDFQKNVNLHFKKEETYYRLLDNDKRVPDRGLVHQLRNDHAAIIFTLESLVIRLRKHGPNDDWLDRFGKMMSVFLAHLDLEDSALFPLGKTLLTPDEIQSIADHIQGLGAH